MLLVRVRVIQSTQGITKRQKNPVTAGGGLLQNPHQRDEHTFTFSTALQCYFGPRPGVVVFRCWHGSLLFVGWLRENGHAHSNTHPAPPGTRRAFPDTGRGGILSNGMEPRAAHKAGAARGGAGEAPVVTGRKGKEGLVIPPGITHIADTGETPPNYRMAGPRWQRYARSYRPPALRSCIHRQQSIDIPLLLKMFISLAPCKFCATP